MKKTMKYILSALAFLMVSLPLIAAAESPPPLAEMWILVPKADERDKFEEGLKKHMAFRQEQGDPRSWQVYVPSLGDDLNRVGIRYCCLNWADVDSYRAWSMENEKIGEHYDKHVAPHVKKAAHYFESISWENSYWSDKNGPYRLFAVTEFNIKAGHAAAFDAARDKMSQIALNHGWASDDHVWMWGTTIGGAPQESIVIPHANWASMDRDEEPFFKFLSRILGTESAAGELMKEFSSTVESTNYQVWVHREDLSMEQDD